MTDPTKTLFTTLGTDTNGEPTRIGGTDSDGYYVGWIHPESGDSYQSIYEFLHSSSAGRYLDAMKDWMRDGGPRPQAEVFVDAALADWPDCVSYREALITDALDDYGFWKRLRRRVEEEGWSF